MARPTFWGRTRNGLAVGQRWDRPGYKEGFNPDELFSPFIPKDHILAVEAHTPTSTSTALPQRGETPHIHCLETLSSSRSVSAGPFNPSSTHSGAPKRTLPSSTFHPHRSHIMPVPPMTPPYEGQVPHFDSNPPCDSMDPAYSPPSSPNTKAERPSGEYFIT